MSRHLIIVLRQRIGQMAENFVMTFKNLSRQMKREINEDTLKQCRDIEIDYRDIENYRRKKFCCDMLT